MKRIAAILLLSLVSLSVLAANAFSGLRDDGAGYAQVVPGKQLVFPEDHGAHPDYRIEWWYLTANLEDQLGQQWGLQWTLFRQALSAEGQPAGWESNQMWMAHAAITTPQGHFYEQRFSRGGVGQAGVNKIAEDGFFNAWIDDWQWRSNTASMFPASLSFSVEGRQINLLLEATGSQIENGVAGYSQKSSQGQASYYYSQPHIKVRGFVSDGLEKKVLSGRGWLDREWSSQPLAANQQGWDWFSLHLDDGYKLMVYQLRHADGEFWRSGSWINPQGELVRLNNDSVTLLSTASRSIKISPEQRKDLPMEWQLSLPGLQRGWRIKPLYDQQWMATTVPYWEGVVMVEDEQGNPAGSGYMELTGYQ